MRNNFTICTPDDLVEAVDELGILQFWSDDRLSAWTMSGVNFNALWSVREEVVNSRRVAYGKYAQKKSTFVSLKVFPYLCSLRRDGYDFDSLCDEGRVNSRECAIMDAVGMTAVPSYNLGKSLGIKGYDTAVTALQDKTYLCLQFKKSTMGTALLCRPEDIFGEELVRSAYALSPAECAAKLKELAPGLDAFNEKELIKILSPAI